MLEKQRKLFIQGNNLKVHDVITYTQKHCATVIDICVTEAVTGYHHLQM